MPTTTAPNLPEHPFPDQSQHNRRIAWVPRSRGLAVVGLVMAVLAVIGISGCGGASNESKPKPEGQTARPEKNGDGSPPPKQTKDAPQKIPPKDEPPTKQPPKQDAKAVRLRQVDSEAMAAFKEGQQRDGMTKLLDAAKTYQKLTPADCTPDEALALAVIYARIASVAGKSLPEETTLVYVAATKEYSKKGGVPSEDHPRWFKQVLSETVAAYKPSEPPAGKTPTWVADAKKELDTAKRRPKQAEPVRPAGSTQAKYDALVEQVDFFRGVYPVTTPDKMPEPEMMLDRFPDAAAVMPHTVAAVRREGFTQLVAKYEGDDLDNLTNAIPAAKRLLDAKFRASMKARLPWADRKKLYDQFTKATGQTEKWSLLVPFDDLTGDEMRAAVAAAEKAKASGLGTVTAADRALILGGGAIDFFASLIPVK